MTDAEAVLIEEEIEATRIVTAGSASGTRIVSREIYTAYETAFAPKRASAVSESDAVDENMTLRITDGTIVVRWMRKNDRPASVFCGRPSYCTNEIVVERTNGELISSAFYGRGIVYSTRDSGVYFSEVDVRPTVLKADIFPQAGADFRIVDGALIVRYKNDLYEITGL